MNCEPIPLSAPYVGYLCRHCQRTIADPAAPGLCINDAEAIVRLNPLALLAPEETAELFPGDSDPTLLGNRVRDVLKAIGFPPCGGCDKRRKWLNKAHAWLRGES
jgi:hypothetical protein